MTKYDACEERTIAVQLICDRVEDATGGESKNRRTVEDRCGSNFQDAVADVIVKVEKRVASWRLLILYPLFIPNAHGFLRSRRQGALQPAVQSIPFYHKPRLAPRLKRFLEPQLLGTLG